MTQVDQNNPSAEVKSLEKLKEAEITIISIITTLPEICDIKTSNGDRRIKTEKKLIQEGGIGYGSGDRSKSTSPAYSYNTSVSTIGVGDTRQKELISVIYSEPHTHVDSPGSRPVSRKGTLVMKSGKGERIFGDNGDVLALQPGITITDLLKVVDFFESSKAQLDDKARQVKEASRIALEKAAADTRELLKELI